MSNTIWFDVDGVLADFVSDYLAILNKHTGRGHTPSDVKRWDFYDVSTWEEATKVWFEIGGTKGFAQQLGECPGMMDVVRKLRGDIKGGGPNVRALTAPPTFSCPTWMHDRLEWLRERQFLAEDVVFTSDKSLVPGVALVDDNPAYIWQWASTNPGGIGILLDRPWNQGIIPANAVRAYTPEDVLKYCRSVE